MKKYLFTLVSLFAIIASANAMSYSQARDEALFLTDKMAYELNLNEQQYEAAYEINLDYLMSINTADDLYGVYWNHRNIDLRHILFDWQYTAFCAATYFFRPVYWNAGYWHFGVYAHYPHRTVFYFNRPVCYSSYRGGHSWRHNGGVSYYERRVEIYHGRGTHVGMRESYRSGRDTYRSNNSRESYRSGSRESYRSNSNRESYRSSGRDTYRSNTTGSYRENNESYRGNVTGRPSSTRITVDRNNGSGASRPSMSGGASRPSMSSSASRPSMSGGASRPSMGNAGGSRAGGMSHGGNVGMSHGGARR